MWAETKGWLNWRNWFGWATLPSGKIICRLSVKQYLWVCHCRKRPADEEIAASTPKKKENDSLNVTGIVQSWCSSSRSYFYRILDWQAKGRLRFGDRSISPSWCRWEMCARCSSTGWKRLCSGETYPLFTGGRRASHQKRKNSRQEQLLYICLIWLCSAVSLYSLLLL